MNTLKRTLALVATLAMAATAFASCGPKDEEPASEPASTPDSSSSEATPDSSESEPAADPSAIDASVGVGGDTFTVAAWNTDDVPYLIAQWKGLDFDGIADKLVNDEVEGIDFICFNVGGGEASEQYDQLFNDGGDLDVYFCEADWALKYINDDSKTLALDKLGLTDANFPNIHSYTDAIGLDSNGVRKGVSWQAAAGGYGYNARLAEEYLGVKTPEEMQAKVADWDKFVATAKEVSEASNGGCAIADSLGGLWQAYACGRDTAWVVDNALQIDDFCKSYADTAKALWDCGGVTKNSQWASDGSWTAAGVSGNCMGYFASTWGFGGFFLDAAGGEGGAEYGNWNLVQGPTPYYWGGTWIVVNPATDNGEEAREFIISACSDEDAMAEYAKNKPEYVNNTVVMDSLISANTVFNPVISGNFKDGQNYFAVLADNAKSIDFNGLITPYDSTIKGAFQDSIRDEMLIGGKSYEDAVETFKNKVAEAITTIDVD
ncbi:MAG: carbohydrate ABC transporter substrate-binding protein [Ruminococcus sp.]|nr:carbohydrate ABC transporter substrate-binding protein [Ruminococcus sp.]